MGKLTVAATQLANAKERNANGTEAESETDSYRRRGSESEKEMKGGSGLLWTHKQRITMSC